MACNRLPTTPTLLPFLVVVPIWLKYKIIRLYLFPLRACAASPLALQLERLREELFGKVLCEPLWLLAPQSNRHRVLYTRAPKLCLPF